MEGLAKTAKMSGDWVCRELCKAEPNPESMDMNIEGIGTDIVECLRIAQMIERHGDLFINRVYTEYEIEYCQRHKALTEHYAGRWAAKEAVLKAIGTGWSRGISWTDVEVRNRPSGQPYMVFRGGVRDVMEKRQIADILLSISHCRTHATAFAIALGKA